jgi:hypothetical protein
MDVPKSPQSEERPEVSTRFVKIKDLTPQNVLT